MVGQDVWPGLSRRCAHERGHRPRPGLRLGDPFRLSALIKRPFHWNLHRVKNAPFRSEDPPLPLIGYARVPTPTAPCSSPSLMIAERSVPWPVSAPQRDISGSVLGGMPGRIAGHTPRRD